MKPISFADRARFYESRNGSRESGFEKRLKGLMNSYGKGLEDIIELLNLAPLDRGDHLLVEAKNVGSPKVYRGSRLPHSAKKSRLDAGMSFVRDLKYRSGKGLLSHKNALFDLCPELLSLDDAQGERLFRDFIRHYNYSGLVFDWTQHLVLYRWLKNSHYAGALEKEHLEAVMTAAISLWCENDKGGFQGLALTHRDNPTIMQGWKGSFDKSCSILEVVPNGVSISPSSDFAFCFLSDNGYESPTEFETLKLI